MTIRTDGFRVALVRHGETTWSSLGRHTSFTDLDLTAEGVEQARRVPGILQELRIHDGSVLVSPRLRALRTAEIAGLRSSQSDGIAVDPDLSEWNYGDYEGLTYAQIQERDPGWSFAGGSPGGESADEVTARVDRLLIRVRSLPGPVVLVCHGHISRAIIARWLELPVGAAPRFAMDPAHVTVLHSYHAEPALEYLNVPPLALKPACDTVEQEPLQSSQPSPA